MCSSFIILVKVTWFCLCTLVCRGFLLGTFNKLGKLTCSVGLCTNWIWEFWGSSESYKWNGWDRTAHPGHNCCLGIQQRSIQKEEYEEEVLVHEVSCVCHYLDQYCVLIIVQTWIGCALFNFVKRCLLNLTETWNLLYDDSIDEQPWNLDFHVCPDSFIW